MSLEKPAHHNPAHQMQPLKNPGVAAVLSFCLPGLGQIYNGQIMWGIIYLVVIMPLTALITFGLALAVVQIAAGGSVFIPFLLPVVMWIGNVVDAYNAAERINRSRHTG